MDEEKENTVAKPFFSGSNRFSPQLLLLTKMDSFPENKESILMNIQNTVEYFISGYTRVSEPGAGSQL